MTETQDITSFEVRSKDEVRPGDLLLVTQIPGEALGRLMERFDGTVLSHSGIAVSIDEDGRPQRDGPANGIASALADNLRYDVGGIRWDRFEKFWPSRDFYTIAMPDALRARALDYLDRFEPTPGEEGAFSFLKLVNVAAGLRSVELWATDRDLGDRLYRACCDVATSWAATPTSPSFYCAELVATAYGRRFTRAEFTPPPARGLRRDIEEPEWASTVMERLQRRVDDLEDTDDRSAATMLALLSSDDWDFVVDASTAIAQSGGKAIGDLLDGMVDRVSSWVRGDEEADPGEKPRAPEALPDPRPMPGLPDPDSPLPHGLVTPRMLWQVFGRDELCRIEQPSLRAH